MTLVLKIIIFAIILAIPITLYINWKEQKRRNDKIEKLPELDINFDTASEEQLNKLKLQEIKKVYIQLIDIENKIDKTNGYLDSIKFCVQLITFIIIVPIIISLVLKLFGISLLSLILN